ncbi:MAG: hypothetical protein CO108_17960 [Deltaproteobacteria bacterium CG_4_9_14_3_um_filter_63_12]|nr:MAG: hypothetical protein CO108_17960 [Deltaproteobacteria bacterium CG_4_9_14_3_um_filter_63_12]
MKTAPPHSLEALPPQRLVRFCQLTAAFAMVAGLFSGCNLTQNSDCVSHSSNYEASLIDEGALAAEAPPEGVPYPMAIVLSQDAVNKLFAAVANADVPPLTIGDTIGGVPLSVTLDAQLPLIQVGGVNGCLTCLFSSMGFGLSVNVAGVAVGGTGAAAFQFPLFVQDNGLESTSFFAQLAQSEVVGIDLQIDGIPSAYMAPVNGLVTMAANAIITNEYGDTKLFDLNAWEVGDGDVKLVGRGPHIDAAQRTIVIGMQSNLVRPENGSIQWNPALPEGADIGLQIAPELIESLIRRMMHEDHIPRSYDESGQANSMGSEQVTLNTMRAGENELLTTSFRLWRTSGGFCGFADLQANLGLSISDKKLRFAAQNVKITDSAGVGNLLQYASNWGGSEFLSNVIDYSEITVNYNEFVIPGGKKADMSAESFRLDLGSEGLSLFLNIEAIVDAVTN